MSVLKNIIVIGAAGNIGKHVTQALLRSGFNVSALTRESSTSTFPEDVRVIKTDYSPDSLKSALSGQDAVVCTIGFEGLGDQIEIAKAAEEVGVKRFIPSEFGNLRNKKSIDALEQRLQAKAKTTEYLQQRAAQNKAFTWSALANGVFFDWQFFLEQRLGRPGLLGFSIVNRSVEIYDSGDAPFTGTTLEATAQAVAQILSKPDETANKFLAVYSVQTTQNEILAAMEELTGEKWKVTHANTKDVLQRGLEGLSKGNRASFVDILVADILTEGRGVLRDDGKYDNELLGVEVEDLKTLLKQVLAAA